MIIKINIDTTSINGLNVEFKPLNYASSCFFRSLKILQFPDYISDLLEDRSFGVENAWFTFFEEMDWEDRVDFLEEFGRDVSNTEIKVSFYDGKWHYSVMKTEDFIQVFYDYSIKLLEVYEKDKNLPENWVSEMSEALVKLKKKVDNNENPQI